MKREWINNLVLLILVLVISCCFPDHDQQLSDASADGGYLLGDA